jgi:AAA family ATP:ADP antiporter
MLHLVIPSAKTLLSAAAEFLCFSFLPPQVKTKGKAAIDVICNPLGKSGGALIQQFMIIGFGSLAASTPYLGVILLSIVLLWINAANSLAGQFAELQGKEDSESVDAGATQTFKYVLDAGSSKGKWVPVAKGESPAGQTKVMTQAEADALNQ